MRDTMPKPRRLLDLDRTVPRSGGTTIHAEFGKPMDITSRRGLGCRPAWQNFASRHVTRDPWSLAHSAGASYVWMEGTIPGGGGPFAAVDGRSTALAHRFRPCDLAALRSS